MRDGALPVVLAIFVAGCSGAVEPDECERHVLRELRSPSTYKEIKRGSFSSPIQLKELQLRYLPEQLDKFDRMILTDLARAKRLELEHVTLEYDAANAYGTPVRDETTCYFLKKDGVRYDPPFAIVDQRTDASIKGTNREFEKNPHFNEKENFSSVVDCCLPF